MDIKKLLNILQTLMMSLAIYKIVKFLKWSKKKAMINQLMNISNLHYNNVKSIFKLIRLTKNVWIDLKDAIIKPLKTP